MSSRISIVVLGHVGYGKSTLCNTLCSFGETSPYRFIESAVAISETRDPISQDGSFCGFQTHLLDTPGIFTVDETLNVEAKCKLAYAIKRDETLQVILLVLNYACPRFGPEEAQLFRILKESYPNADYLKHVAVVWTHYSTEDSDETEKADRMQAVRDGLKEYIMPDATPTQLAGIRQYFVHAKRARQPGVYQNELNKMLNWARTVRTLKEDGLSVIRVPAGPPRKETRQRTEYGQAQTERWSTGLFHHCHHGVTTQEQTAVTEERTVTPMTDGTSDYTPWVLTSRNTKTVTLNRW